MPWPARLLGVIFVVSFGMSALVSITFLIEEATNSHRAPYDSVLNIAHTRPPSPGSQVKVKPPHPAPPKRIKSSNTVSLADIVTRRFLEALNAGEILEKLRRPPPPPTPSPKTISEMSRNSFTLLDARYIPVMYPYLEICENPERDPFFLQDLAISPKPKLLEMRASVVEVREGGGKQGEGVSVVHRYSMRGDKFVEDAGGEWGGRGANLVVDEEWRKTHTLKIDGHVTHAGSVSPFPREKDSTRSGVTEGDSWIVVAYHQLEMEKEGVFSALRIRIYRFSSEIASDQQRRSTTENVHFEEISLPGATDITALTAIHTSNATLRIFYTRRYDPHAFRTICVEIINSKTDPNTQAPPPFRLSPCPPGPSQPPKSSPIIALETQALPTAAKTSESVTECGTTESVTECGATDSPGIRPGLNQEGVTERIVTGVGVVAVRFRADLKRPMGLLQTEYYPFIGNRSNWGSSESLTRTTLAAQKVGGGTIFLSPQGIPGSRPAVAIAKALDGHLVLASSPYIVAFNSAKEASRPPEEIPPVQLANLRPRTLFTQASLSATGETLALADNLKDLVILRRNPYRNPSSIRNPGSEPTRAGFRHKDRGGSTQPSWEIKKEVNMPRSFMNRQILSLYFLPPHQTAFQGKYDRLAVLFEGGGLAVLRIRGSETTDFHINQNSYGENVLALEMWEISVACLCMLLFLASSALRFDRYFPPLLSRANPPPSPHQEAPVPSPPPSLSFATPPNEPNSRRPTSPTPPPVDVKGRVVGTSRSMSSTADVKHQSDSPRDSKGNVNPLVTGSSPPSSRFRC
ncbi:hypothetical protein AAMO2058_000091800 [Amorphochlora amoebiformis]